MITHSRFFITCLAGALVLGGMQANAQSAESPKASENTALTGAVSMANDLSLAFENVADSISPSVVTITSVAKAKPTRHHGGRMDPYFDRYRDLFGDDFFDRLFPDNPPEGFAQQGMGTGVIVDTDGHILTNNHVVGGADEVEITVRLQNEKTFKAKLIGTDPKTDLAVIQIKAPGLQPANLGESDKLKIGEWVVAAGNPFGLSNSITAGIVSAKGRSFMGGGQFEDFIQTDAAINPGNSGGPLVNLKGEVVGINTAIFSKSGGYMGIGFAIPINMAKSVMTSLIKTGKVVRGWLGIGIQPITEDAARSFGFSGTEGALVGHVENGSPAEGAGLRQGDIVVAINGERIKTVNQLRNIVAATKPGAQLSIELYRDNHKTTVAVKVGELKGQKEAERATEAQSSVDLGITLEPLSERSARELSTKRTEGVVVTSVRPGGIGEQSGIQVRDIILSVNGKRVRNIAEFNEAIEKADLRKGIRLVVETQGMERFVFPRAEE